MANKSVYLDGLELHLDNWQLLMKPPLKEGGPRRRGNHSNLYKHTIKQGVVSNLHRHLFPPFRLGNSGARRRRLMTCFPGNQVDCISPISFSFNRMFKNGRWNLDSTSSFRGANKLAIGQDDSGCTAASGKVARIRTAAPHEVYAAYGRLCWPGAAPQARPLFFWFFLVSLAP